MASAEDIAQVRRDTNELEDAEPYTDAVVGALIDEAGSTDAASARIWDEKSSMYAEMVDISEAGSSRKNGVLYKNAKEQAAKFAARADGTETTLPVGTYTTTRKIVRA